MTPPVPGDRLEDRTDPELVALSRDGDRAALEVLLRRHHDRIHLLCRRLCTDRGDAEDATQNALLAIVRGLGGFDGSAAFSTWSHRVATNACLDELRRRGRRPLTRAGDVAETTDGVVAAERNRWSSNGTGAGRSDGLDADPAEQVVRGEQRTLLQRALAELPEEFRVPVVLRDVGELDYAEIAELLDLAPGTVRSRISRGRRKLAEALHAQPVNTSPSGSTGQPGNPRAAADVRELES